MEVNWMRQQCNAQRPEAHHMEYGVMSASVNLKETHQTNSCTNITGLPKDLIRNECGEAWLFSFLLWVLRLFAQVLMFVLHKLEEDEYYCKKENTKSMIRVWFLSQDGPSPVLELTTYCTCLELLFAQNAAYHHQSKPLLFIMSINHSLRIIIYNDDHLVTN